MAQHEQETILRLLATLDREHLSGKHDALQLAIIALLCGGHLLLEDRPGLGKTTLALALARATGLLFGRVQCTSDLLPSDITGLSILDRAANDFRFIPGPIFCNILLVDELNRAMPRTQSALLEAMEERCVTVEGVTHPLPEPFMVIATQNPGEQVGTFPLPESQLDRFLISTGIGYPSAEIERQIIAGGSIRDELKQIVPLITHEELLASRKAAQKEVHLAPAIIDYIHRIAVATRTSAMVSAGISPRGAIALAQSARARAWLDGRDHVIPEDIQAMLLPVSAHRLILRPEHEGINKREVLSSLVRALPVPR
jgi:MoxR-like ATPase